MEVNNLTAALGVQEQCQRKTANLMSVTLSKVFLLKLSSFLLSFASRCNLRHTRLWISPKDSSLQQSHRQRNAPPRRAHNTHLIATNTSLFTDTTLLLRVRCSPGFRGGQQRDRMHRKAVATQDPVAQVISYSQRTTQTNSAFHYSCTHFTEPVISLMVIINDCCHLTK